MLRADVIELDRLLHQEEKEFPLAENEYGDVKDFEYFDSIEPPKKYAEMGVQTVGRFNMKKNQYKEDADFDHELGVLVPRGVHFDTSHMVVVTEKTVREALRNNPTLSGLHK